MAPVKSTPVLEEARRDARRLALGLLASGKDRPEVELQLFRWQVHPAIAHEATQWAWAVRRPRGKTSRRRAAAAHGRVPRGPGAPAGPVRARYARWARGPGCGRLRPVELGRLGGEVSACPSNLRFIPATHHRNHVFM